MILWRRWQYSVDILYHRGLAPLSCSGYPSLCYICTHWKNILNIAHVLSWEDLCCHFQMYLLKLAVCVKRVIAFDTIITSEIVCPISLENSFPFSSWSIRRARGYMRLYESSWLRFPLGQFCLLPCRKYIYVITSTSLLLVKNLSVGKSMGTERLAEPPGRFTFYWPVYGGAASEQILILSKPFGSKRLLLGGPNCWGVINGVVLWYKCVAYMRQAVFRGHGES